MKFLFAIFSISLLLFLKTSASTLEDAKQALDELDFLSLTKQGELHLVMNDQSVILRERLSKILSSTKEQITDQTDDILDKISVLAENTKKTGADIDICIRVGVDNIKMFAANLEETLNNCYGNMIQTGNSMLYSIWSRVWNEYDSDYRCNKLSLSKCETYGDEGCFDFVIENIEKNKPRLNNTVELLKIEMENKITGMNIPCQGMILEDLEMYLSLNFQFIEACLDSLFDESFTSLFSC